MAEYERKPFKLSHNYRTHSGVLRLANDVLDVLCKAFESLPASNDRPLMFIESR